MPQEVSAELRRVVDRWHLLPLDQAQARVPLLRALVDELAAETAAGAGPVPDLGPHTLPDQLTVLVHDACTADVPDLHARLTQLRRLL